MSSIRAISVLAAISMVILATHLAAANLIDAQSLVSVRLLGVWRYAVTLSAGVLTVLTFAMLFDNRMRVGRGLLDRQTARRWFIALIVACPFGAGIYYLRVVAASHEKTEEYGQRRGPTAE